MTDRSFTSSDGEEYRWIDGDTTIDSEGNRQRAEGFNARETSKLIRNSDGEIELISGDVGGSIQADAIARIQREGNFFNVNDTGETDSSEGERSLVTYTNPEGESLANALYASGAIRLDEGASEEAVRMKREADLVAAVFGDEAVPYKDIANEVNRYIDGQGLRYKTLALNEKEFDPEIHSGVKFRHSNRDMYNRAEGLLGVGAGWDLGVEGLKEGLSGYADAIGETVGWEWLENLGEAGLARSRERISMMPEITLDYKDVDSVKKGFEYVINNIAVAAPQMLSMFGSMAVAVPVTAVAGPIAGGVVALSPIAIVSAGQTYNEMEGDRGAPQFLAASLAGIGVSSLERFGLSKLISPGKVLSEEGERIITEALKKKAKEAGKVMTTAQAKGVYSKVVRTEIANFTKGLSLRMTPEMIRDFSLAEVGKRGLQGLLVEGGTEIAQDALMMGTAAATSDTTFSEQEIQDRLINAGLAGSSVGGPLSIAGSLHHQGKRKLLKSSRMIADPERFSLMENKRARDDAQGINIPNTEDIAAKFSTPIPQVKVNEKIYKPSDSAWNLMAKSAHDRYKKAKVGITKQFSDAETPAEYISALVDGLSKLVLAMEVKAMPMEKLLASSPTLASFHLWAGETTGRYHEGANHKEYQDLQQAELESEIDNEVIAKMFNVRSVKFNNAKKISRQIIDFAKSGQFKKWNLYTLNSMGAFAVAKIYLDRKTTPAARAAARERLRQLGFLKNIQIEQYFNAVAVRDKASGKIVQREIKLTDDKGNPLTLQLEEAQRILYMAAKQFESAYARQHDLIEKHRAVEVRDNNNLDLGFDENDISYDENAWWQDQGFDWEKVKKNKEKFLSWIVDNTDLTRDNALDLYESIVREGQGNVVTTRSLVQGATFKPWTTYSKLKGYASMDGFEDFASENLFQAAGRNAKDAAKYAAVTKYFGHGGRKLNNIYAELKQDLTLTDDVIDQYMYYMITAIDSSHGNFNRIENPRWAAVNSFLTSWSLMAGLPMAALSSIPETPMVYFNIKDDVEFNKASKQLINQIGQAFNTAINEEVKQTEGMLKAIGQSADSGSVVNRLATGERDVAFLRLHEAFFRGTGIIKITQVQRRMAAGFAIDFIRNGLDILALAPKKIETQIVKTAAGIESEITNELGLDFDKMNDYEMRAYNQLVDLGLDIERLQEMLKDLEEEYRSPVFNIASNRPVDISDEDFIKSPLPREKALRKIAMGEFNSDSIEDGAVIMRAGELQAEVNDMVGLAVYRFVKERIQLPGAANRPLFMQDPHYQLFTQFNGFISTFTANVIPKIWNRQIRKGSPAVKYDTFALIITMIALGGASQYLKDLLKFGESSPYLDTRGYMQRALYSSGVMGQYERLADLIVPLYPERADSSADQLFQMMLGEAGPTARNIATVLDATSDLIQGEGRRALTKYGKATPGLGPFTGTRYAIADAATGENPLRDVTLPDGNEIRDYLLR